MTRQAGLVVATWALAIVLAASTQSAAQASLANAGAPQTSLATAGAAQESLATARQLYASADYKNALTMLNALLALSPSPQERQSIELYRTFCLVAIGNTDEANKAIEAMVSRDPLYRPNMDDVPPRLRTVFSDARKRLLPALIQERYIIAKTAFDRADYKSASEGFTQVLIALSDPDIAPAAKQPPLADLRVLASGFSDLTVRALTPAPVPVVPMTVQAPPPPAAMPPRPAVALIYTQDDKTVLPPAVVRQDIPAFSGKVPFDRVGVIEVVIDPSGAVESASMVQPSEPLYDQRLLAAAKNWIYRPARLDGAPVKYRRRIQINLTRTQ
jgi:Gram-negative bacterial TonB protein C-terminal